MNDNNFKQEKQHTHEFKPKIPRKEQISTWNIFLVILLISFFYYLFKYTNIDSVLIAAVIALTGIGIEMFSHLFTYALTLIQSIPHIGPIIIKVITWPIFVTLNIAAYFVSLIVIRFKGIAMVKDARILTTIFLIGILIGFILGRLF